MTRSFILEIANAFRGLIMLLAGRRDAPQWFNLTLSGLAGSFIAFLLALSLNGFGPYLLGATAGVQATMTIIVSLVLFVFQAGFAYLALRQMKRTDGFVPYLICDNWATFATTLLSFGLGLLGIGSGMIVLLIFVIALAISINVARLVVTLRPMQIAIFLIAQLVGVMIAMQIIGLFLPGLLAEQQAVIQSSLSGS